MRPAPRFRCRLRSCPFAPPAIRHRRRWLSISPRILRVELIVKRSAREQSRVAFSFAPSRPAGLIPQPSRIISITGLLIPRNLPTGQDRTSDSCIDNAAVAHSLRAVKWRNQVLALICSRPVAGLGVLYFQNWVVQKPFAIILFLGEGLTTQRMAATRVYSGRR